MCKLGLSRVSKSVLQRVLRNHAPWSCGRLSFREPHSEASLASSGCPGAILSTKYTFIMSFKPCPRTLEFCFEALISYFVSIHVFVWSPGLPSLLPATLICLRAETGAAGAHIVPAAADTVLGTLQALVGVGEGRAFTPRVCSSGFALALLGSLAPGRHGALEAPAANYENLPEKQRLRDQKGLLRPIHPPQLWECPAVDPIKNILWEYSCVFYFFSWHF